MQTPSVPGGLLRTLNLRPEGGDQMSAYEGLA
jgi:hypothetical protein